MKIPKHLNNPIKLNYFKTKALYETLSAENYKKSSNKTLTDKDLVNQSEALTLYREATQALLDWGKKKMQHVCKSMNRPFEPFELLFEKPLWQHMLPKQSSKHFPASGLIPLILRPVDAYPETEI